MTITTLFITLLMCTTAWAGDIDAGTLAVGASSDALFHLSDNGDNDFDQTGVSLSADIGYFVIRNLEVGTALRLSYSKHDYGENKSYFLIPFVAYHWSLNEKSDIYAKLGAGYGLSESDIDVEQTIVSGEIGYEYFVTKNIAIGLSLAGEQSRVELKDDYNGIDEKNTFNHIITQVKFRLYF